MSYCEQKKEMVVTLVRKFCEEFGVPQQNIVVITNGVLDRLKKLINKNDVKAVANLYLSQDTQSVELDETLIRNSVRTAIRDLADNKLANVARFREKIAQMSDTFQRKQPDLDDVDYSSAMSFGKVRFYVLEWLRKNNIMLPTNELLDLINKVNLIRQQEINDGNSPKIAIILGNLNQEIKKVAIDMTRLSGTKLEKANNFIKTQSFVLYWLYKRGITLEPVILNNITQEAYDEISTKFSKKYYLVLLKRILDKKFNNNEVIPNEAPEEDVLEHSWW